MRKSTVALSALLLLPQLLVAQAPEAKPATAPAAAPSSAKAEVKAGLGVEKHEVTGASDNFKVAAGTKIYAWLKVSGTPKDAKVTVTFRKGDSDVFKTELNVPTAPYRTQAYRTFRKGDEGDWKARVLGPDGAEIGSAAFKVEITGS